MIDQILSGRLSKQLIRDLDCGIALKPGLHIVVIIARTVANMFLALSQALFIHANPLITTLQALPALSSVVQFLPTAMIPVTIEDMYPALSQVVLQI